VFGSQFIKLIVLGPVAPTPVKVNCRLKCFITLVTYCYNNVFVYFKAGLAKNMFFLFKTKHTVFFCLKHVLNLVKKNMFKPILNTNKTALNRLKSLLCCCTFTLNHWACALRSCIAILQLPAKLPKFRFIIIVSCYPLVV
jgi:hypothetical protein